MTTSTQWPNIGQYRSAVQDPATAFADAGLRAARIDLTEDGLPDCVPGQHAIVFFGESAGSRIVIRCFKRPPNASAADRYTGIYAYLAAHPVPAFARAVWLERGISVGGAWRPVVWMEDVEGRSLRRYVEEHLARPDKLVALADAWSDLIEQMSRQQVAHGDFQQDNIRVLPDGRIRLIDLDGVWAPTVAHLPPAEIGQPNFQHPGRATSAHWGPNIDLFSAVVVYISLLAVTTDPGLWDYHNGENLVFTAADYENPMGTEIWHRVAGNRDVRVRELLAVLNQLCRLPVNIELDPAQVLRERKIPGQEMPTIGAVEADGAWWPAEAAEPPTAVPADDYWAQSAAAATAPQPPQQPRQPRPIPPQRRPTSPKPRAARLPGRTVAVRVGIVAVIFILVLVRFW